MPSLFILCTRASDDGDTRDLAEASQPTAAASRSSLAPSHPAVPAVCPLCSGGSSNAFTSSENTNYYFDVRHEYLPELLDRFSQFFISPLFTPSATERELQAVHSEHSKNILTDIWRSSQCIKHLALPSHPYHKFGTGNAQTLRDTPRAEGVDVRAALLAFHRLHYSANRMRLVVLGRETLDVLQGWVEDRFSAIENRAMPAPAFDGAPFALSAGSALHRSSVRIVPIKDLRSLTLLFPLPSIDSLYHSKPTYLISHLIGHESAGSILSLLKALSYANALSGGHVRHVLVLLPLLHRHRAD